jgi:transcriptional regulator with XRE-family HTH domain
MDVFSIQPESTAMKTLLESAVNRKSRPDMVGPRITALRESLAMSKAQFADSLDLDRSSLTKIEVGKAGLDILIAERIAVIYGVGLDFIYRGILSDAPLDLRTKILAKVVALGTVSVIE